MSSSMKHTKGYVGCTDLFKIDPRKIVVQEGWNPRSSIDTAALEELKASIRDNGFYPDKPLLLHRRVDQLVVISGHRRLQAVLELIDEGVPLVAIPAVLDQSGDQGDLLARALAANQNGVALDPLDEANGFRRLIGYGWEPKRIAEKVGRSVSHVYSRLKLLEAEPEVLQAIETKDITATDAVRVVKQSGRNGVSQSAALAGTIEKRQAKKSAQLGRSSPDRITDVDERTMRRLLDDYGVAWIVRVVLDYADKSEVLDYIHEIAEGVAS